MPAPDAAQGQADEQSAPGLSGPAFLRLILIGAAIGIPAALVAVGFLALVQQLQDLLWEDLPDALDRSSPPWYLILALPAIGACLVAAARKFLPGDGGHRPVDGLSAAPMAAAYGPSVALAALGTLSFGAVLGPEAPLIALGSVVGMLVAPLFKLGPKESAVLATAGSFAAIAALFGGPIPAGVLMVEASVGMGLGAALIPMLLPGLVAAATGFLIFTGIGDWGGVKESTLKVPGLAPYDGVHFIDLGVGLAVGLLAAALIWGCQQGARAVAAREGKGLSMPGLVVAGGFAVGGLALLAEGLGADSQEVLFSGQAGLPALLAEGSAGIVVVILATKALAYAVSLGCGFRGGPVFPGIFLGVALAMLSVIAFDVSPTLAVAVGTAAGMAAATRLMFSSLVIAALLVGSQAADAVPAAVLAAVGAYVGVMVLEQRFGGAPATARDAAPA